MAPGLGCSEPPDVVVMVLLVFPREDAVCDGRRTGSAAPSSPAAMVRLRPWVPPH